MDNVIERKLLNDIIDYCRLNGIEVDMYVNQKLRSALMIDKYGSSPFDNYAYAKVENVDMSEDGKELAVEVAVKPNPKLVENDVPFIVTPQEKIDCGAKIGELKPLEPMIPDDDYIKERAQKKTDKSEKLDDGKIIVNKRALK